MSTVTTSIPVPVDPKGNGHQQNGGKETIFEVKKGEMYLLKLEETINHLKEEISKTEKILESESDRMNEEIIGDLLCSIGKGNLLIAQKLRQFRELCHKNINGNHYEQFPTKNEDLEGFWEMVYIQVEDVLNGFQEIYKLKQNNWINITNNNESPTSKITQPKIRSPKKVIIASKTSPNQQQSNPPTTRNTVRDEMRKQRLKEAKQKSASRLQEMKQLADDIVIYVPPPPPPPPTTNGNGKLLINGSNGSNGSNGCNNKTDS